MDITHAYVHTDTGVREFEAASIPSNTRLLMTSALNSRDIHHATSGWDLIFICQYVYMHTYIHTCVVTNENRSALDSRDFHHTTTSGWHNI